MVRISCGGLMAVYTARGRARRSKGEVERRRKTGE